MCATESFDESENTEGFESASTIRLRAVAKTKKAGNKTRLLTGKVTIAKWCATMGETDPAVRSRIACGTWVKGKHYKKEKNRIKLVLHECITWYDENRIN